MSEMYNPKESKFCFHVDLQRVYIKPCKLSRKALVGGFRRAVTARAVFFHLRSEMHMGAKVSEEPESSFSVLKKSRMSYKI